MNHNINLTGYTATCGEPNNMLDLGTAGSYGLEKLHVTADAAWNGLTITATFTNSGSTTVAVSDGAVDVPPEATRLPTRDRVRYGMIAFKGVDAQGKLRIISTPIYYKVQASAATDGSNTIDPTPDQYAQFVAEVMAEADRAEAAADRAESAGGNVTPEQIAEAVNNYLDENPVQATTIDATLTQSGQAADAKAVGDAIANIELTPGPAGANGITPTIGSNGNWYLGDTDTGKPSRGETGPAGANGTDGKSAYQYAVEGGYTGTEEEFAAKLATEIPEVSRGWKLIRTIDVVAGTASYSFNTDNDGNTFKLKNFMILIDSYPTNGYLEINQIAILHTFKIRKGNNHMYFRLL